VQGLVQGFRIGGHRVSRRSFDGSQDDGPM
jgi:hypothetical protein